MCWIRESSPIFAVMDGENSNTPTTTKNKDPNRNTIMKSPIRELAILAALTCLCAVSPAFSADTQAPEGTILGMKSISRPSALVYVDVRSGETHELLPGDACGPCFSPDGQSIAFVYKDMIYVAPRNDIEARRQLVPTKGSYNKHLSWADDGHIYFGEDWPYSVWMCGVARSRRSSICLVR
jgi:Tol biopolymer transport system component